MPKVLPVEAPRWDESEAGLSRDNQRRENNARLITGKAASVRDRVRDSVSNSWDKVTGIFRGNKSGVRPTREVSQNGGAQAQARWCATKKKVKCHDGVTRALYRHPAKPGDLRVRKMVTRGGRTVATYVKP
jgi:hypothetical protein